ncbi:Hemicentin-1 [Dactylella cylindrospora]|nr:Hemicentin-1 [Dactylella cylindrospora]
MVHPKLLCLLACMGTPTWAFFPNSFLVTGGIVGIDHRAQTRWALEAIYEEFGISVSETVYKAREAIQEANENTDFEEAHDPAAHFDGEKFVNGTARLKDLYQGILADMEAGRVTDARIKAGKSLHTVQDFYAHSNYVELGNDVPHPGVIGNPTSENELGPASGAIACGSCAVNGTIGCDIGCATRFTGNALGYLGCIANCTCPACDDSLVATELTSGYFFGQGADKPDGKCAHGGPFDAAVWSDPANLARNPFGINKDSSNCTFSPHGGRYHSDAADLAIQASIAWLQDLQEGLGDIKFNQFIGLGSSLGIAIDTTGSMQPIIDRVRTEAIAIVDRLVGTPDEPSFYVLALFNDPEVGPAQIYTNATAFKEAIEAVFADGGGDCPELSITGMRQAVAALGGGGPLFMFTDADASDAYLNETLIEEANAKGIKIITAVFGECEVGGREIYKEISQKTLGQYFEATPDTAGTIIRLVDAIGTSSSVDLYRAVGNLGEAEIKRRGTAAHEVDVDSTMNQVAFSLSATSASLGITKPDGTPINEGDTGVIYTKVDAGTFVTVDNPQSGKYKVGLDGSGDYSLAVSGISALSFTKFSFLQATDGMHHDWVGYLTSKSTPAAGSTAAALAVVDGSYQTAQFEVRTQSGAVSKAINLVGGSGADGDRARNEFVGNFQVPDCPFVIYVTGKDATGALYQRVSSELYTPPGGKAQCDEPSGPTSPTTTPGSPGTPTTTPSTPSTPSNPNNPSTPANPSNPTNPTNPAGPSGTGNPTNPSNPANPTDTSGPGGTATTPGSPTGTAGTGSSSTDQGIIGTDSQGQPTGTATDGGITTSGGFGPGGPPLTFETSPTFIGPSGTFTAGTGTITAPPEFTGAAEGLRDMVNYWMGGLAVAFAAIVLL